MKNLNDIVGFLSEQSTKKFSNYAEKDPSKIQEIDDGTGGTKSDVSRARQVIFSVTYDIERFMAGQNALDNINPNPELRDRIDRFYADFARAVQLSTSYDANPADIDRILNDLATRQEDIKIAQMLRDLNNNKPITVDVDDDKNNGDKSNFKDSKLAQVIDAVGASGKFDNAKINGIKVSEYKKSAESSGKPYVDLNTAIHQSATDKQFFNKLVSDTVQTRASGILDMASKTMGFQGFHSQGGRLAISSPEVFGSMFSDGVMEKLGIGTRNADGTMQMDRAVSIRIAEALKDEIRWDKSAIPSFAADGLDFCKYHV